jgi:hypothetical protein
LKVETGEHMAEEFLPPEDSDSGNQTTTSNQTDSRRERIKHLLIGSRKAVRATINVLHVKGYAEVREWSKFQSAGVLGEPGEVVSVLIRQVSPE